MEATWTPTALAPGTPQDKTRTTPPQPRPAPVFIHDAVTPWGHGTLLLKLLRDADEK